MPVNKREHKKEVLPNTQSNTSDVRRNRQGQEESGEMLTLPNQTKISLAKESEDLQIQEN